MKAIDLIDGPWDRRKVGAVQPQGRHTFVGVLQRAACSRIYPLRPTSERFIDERPADTATGAGDQDCLICNAHIIPLILGRRLPSQPKHPLASNSLIAPGAAP